MTIKRAIIGLLSTLGVLAASAEVQAATILPPAKTCFYDSNGDPLAAGTVGMYIPTTMTAKDTWQDSGQVTLNVDPVPLDSAGCALIYGTGTYRQIVKDALSNTIWDQLTADPSGGLQSWGGISGGTANVITVTAGNFSSSSGQIIWFKAGTTNTGPATMTVSGGSPITVYRDTSAGPLALVGSEIVQNNVVGIIYDATLGGFHIIGQASSGGLIGDTVSISPSGRLTLTSGTPVLVTGVSGATTVYYTPYNGNSIRMWNGSVLVQYSFTETSLALDSNNAHTGYQQSGKNFDLFMVADLSNPPAVLRLCSGPAWSTATTRGIGAGTTELEYKLGLLANKNSMTCRYDSSVSGTVTAGIDTATYVGTMRATANGQTSFTMAPAAASGGTASVLGLWNNYNQVGVFALVTDSGAQYNYGSATVRQARASAGNQISFINGNAWNAASAVYKDWMQTGAAVNAFCRTGIGVDVTNAFYNDIYGVAFTTTTDRTITTDATTALIPPLLGWHVIAAVESGDGTNTCTFNAGGNGVLEFSAQM